MPTELDRLLTDSLHARAEHGSPIDPAPLMQAAVGRGKRIQTRRRITTATLAAAVVGAVVLAGVFVPRVAQQATAGLELLPDAAGPGAGARPDLVGSDPNVIHFSLDSLAKGAGKASWQSTATYESAGVMTKDLQMYAAVSRDRTVLPSTFKFLPPNTWVAGDPEPVTIGGRPGTATKSSTQPALPPGNTGWSLLWQPVDGLWAYVVVTGDDLARAVHLAEGIRFDRAKRCAVPFTVGAPPAGSKLVSCSINLDTTGSGLFRQGDLIFEAGRKQVTFSGRPADGDSISGPTVQAGPNKVWADPRAGTWSTQIDGEWLAAINTPKTAWSQPQMLASLATVRALDQDHPGRW